MRHTTFNCVPPARLCQYSSKLAQIRMRGRHPGSQPNIREACKSAARSVRQHSAPSMTRLATMAFALVMMLCWTSTALGKEVRGLGFFPPFQTFNARGDRTVSSFSFVGGASAKQSFVRLTPDERQHFGALFSRLSGRFSTGPPGGELSLVMNFRVSGKAENNHGNYLAIIIGSPDMIRRTGDTYGVPEDFVGIGVVISARPPADFQEPSLERPQGPRQFVSFIANNGTRTTEQVRMLASSCASTLRYWQGRDDFNFLKSSRLRLGYYDGEVNLELDARNVGVWRKCLTTKVDDMPPGWLDRTGVVMVGETGSQVSNNHDVMSLEIYNEKQDAFDTAKVDGDTEDEADPQAEALETRKKRMYRLKAHMEHEFDSVERILKDSLDKLTDVNEGMLRRLTKLEKDISTEAFSRLHARVKDIESRVTSTSTPALEQRLKVAEEMWSGEVGDSLERLMQDGKGHRLPFILILGVVVLLFAASVQQYRKLMRSNFLGSMR